MTDPNAPAGGYYDSSVMNWGGTPQGGGQYVTGGNQWNYSQYPAAVSSSWNQNTQGGFAATGDQNWNQALVHDWTNDHTKPSYYSYSAIPGYDMYRAVEGDKAWSAAKNAKSTADYNNHIANQRNAIGSQWDTYGQGLQDQFQKQGDARMGAVDSIQSAYASPDREQARQQLYSATLDNSLAQNTAQYQGQSQQAGLSAISSGLGGSSVDAEQQAKLGANYAANNYAAQNQAYGGYQQQVQADQSQQQNLLLGALSGNQNQQQAYASMAQANTNQSQMLNQNAAFNAANIQMSNGYHANQSQQYGNAFTQAGNAYQQYNVGQAYQQQQQNQSQNGMSNYYGGY